MKLPQTSPSSHYIVEGKIRKDGSREVTKITNKATGEVILDKGKDEERACNQDR